MSKLSSNAFIKTHFMHIIFQEQVSINQSRKKSKRKKETLIITDQVFLLDDGSEFIYFYWISVNSININGKEIEIKFSTDTIEFTPTKTDSKQILAIIIDLLQRILVPKKFQKVNESKFYTDPPPITGHSIIIRFLGYYNPNSAVEKENSNLFRLKIMTKDPVLKLQNFQSYQILMPAVFHAMSFINFIKYLDFGEATSILADLTKNFKVTRKLIKISFGCNDKGNFSGFLDKFASNDSKIECLSFSSLSLNYDDCQNFINKLKLKKISYLGFHKNSILQEGLDVIQQKASSLPNLIFLNFNGYPILDLESLSSKISFITILSLSNCNLNIPKAMKLIFQSNFFKLSELDLSSNQCDSQFNLKEDFPPQLSKLVANDINWKNSKNFISFLTFIFSKMNNILKLNVSSSEFDDLDEWKNVFNKLSQLDFDLSSIQSIGWDKNPIHESFFNFIEDCTNLKTLSISSFTVLKGKGQIETLCNYLKNNKSRKIKTLIFSCDDSIRTKFENKISEIFNSLKKWKSLTTLDISDNMIGDDGLDGLKSLLIKNPIKLVSFDNSKPSSIQNLIGFFTSLPKEIKVNFPCEDVLSFMNSKKPNFDAIQSLIQLSSKMIDDKNNNLINLQTDTNVSTPPSKKYKTLPKPEQSPLDKQFFVFNDMSYKNDLYLPEYIESSQYKPLKVTTRKAIKKEDESDNDNDDDESYDRRKSKRKSNIKKGNVEEIDDDKKKKMKPKKIKNNYDESDDSDSEKDKKATIKKSKRKNYDESDDNEYEMKTHWITDKKKATSRNKRTPSPPSPSSSSSEDEDGIDDYEEKQKKKIVSKYEMQTLFKNSNHPQRKSSPKSLTGNNKNNKSKSLYEMHTKGGHHSYLGVDKDDYRRKKSNKFDNLDESNSSENEKDLRNQKSKKKIPPKIIYFDESPDDVSEDSFEHRIKIKEKSSKNRVQQRTPPPLERSDDDDEYDMKVKSKIQLVDEADDEDEENNFSPKPPDWSFPLLFVPSPDDSKQIVDDLSEKYSVGNLLRCMYQS